MNLQNSNVRQNGQRKIVVSPASTNPGTQIKLTPLSSGKYVWRIWEFKSVGHQYDLKSIYREGVLRLLSRCKIQKIPCVDKYVRIDQNIVKNISVEDIKRLILNWINKTTLDIHKWGIMKNAFVEIWHKQSHLLLNTSWLENLDKFEEGEVLRDEQDRSYVPFRNCVVEVRAGSITEHSYKSMPGLIWQEQVIQRDFFLDQRICEFSKFIRNVTDGDRDRIKSMHTAIGYLLHGFSDPSISKAVIAYDEELTNCEIPEGGTGKGVLGQAVSKLRSLKIVDGKKFDNRDRFSFQGINFSTQIVQVDDIKDGDHMFNRFNSILSEGLEVEEKNRSNFRIPRERLPKFYFTSNFILPMEGNTHKRRQHIVVFGSYYSNLQRKGCQQPIIHEHGSRFFYDWDTTEWRRFDTFMLRCMGLYLKEGLFKYEHQNVNRNRLAQRTSQEFTEWIYNAKLQTDKKHNTKKLFDQFVENYGETVSQRQFSNWIGRYCDIEELDRKVTRSNGISYTTVKKSSCLSDALKVS